MTRSRQRHPPVVEPLERRVLCSAVVDWRSANGLVRTTTRVPFGIGGSAITATAAGNRAFFTGAPGPTLVSRFTNVLAIFDTSTGKWSKARLSQPHNDGAATAAGGMAIFAGGFIDSHDQETATADIYDPSTGQTSAVQLSAPFYRYYYANNATAVDGLAVFPTGDVYDTQTGQLTSTQLGQPPNVFRLPAAATSVDHLAFFAGGEFSVAATTRVTDTVNIYNATTGQWSIAHLSQKRAGLAATSVGDLAMFAGGYDDVDNHYDTVDIYDAATDQWSVSHLPEANSILAATTVGNFAMFVGATVDVYDASTGVWFTTSLSSNRGGVGAAAANGKAFFAGIGRPPSNGLDIFTLSPDIIATLPAKPGGKVVTTVQCTGDVPLPPGATVSLYASPDGTLTGATLIGSATLPSGLAAQASRKLSIATSLASVPTGRYHLIAAADDDTGQGAVVIASQANTFTVRSTARHAPASHPFALRMRSATGGELL